MNNPAKYIIIGLIFLSSNIYSQDKGHTINKIFDVSYLEKDIEEDTLRRINFYMPNNVKNPPLLIWIGGGGWSMVNRYQEGIIAKRFAEEGIAVAALGHRLSACEWAIPDRTTGVKHPAHIKDVAQAFSWLTKNAADYGYDPQRIFVGGFSSGGHLSALIATDGRYLKEYGLKFENIRGIIPVSGGYDIEHYYQTIFNDDPSLAKLHVNAVFGDTEEDFKDASPTVYLKHLSVPMLMFSDSQTYIYARIFEKMLREETDYIDFEVVHVHKLNHNQIWHNLAASKSRYRSMIVDFIRKHS